MGIFIEDSLNKDLKSQVIGAYSNFNKENINITYNKDTSNFTCRARCDIFVNKETPYPFTGLNITFIVIDIGNLCAEIYTELKTNFSVTTDDL